MTIEEIKESKKQLAKSIADLTIEFESYSPVHIEEVKIDLRSVRGANDGSTKELGGVEVVLVRI